MDIDNLSLDEKIGQRFIVGINNENIDVIIELVKKAYIGGVILYKRNYQTYDEMINVIKSIKLANKDNKIPLFIAIDEEGGRVNRLPCELHNLKNIYDVSRCDINLVSDYANIIGKTLNNIGINMNLAPVLDIDNGSRVKSLYKRCFYGDKSRVEVATSKYMEGINNMVIPVIKHYPGHGLTKKDTHFTIPYIFNLKEYESHIDPFNKAIENGIDALMVGHLAIPKLTGLLPASISDKFLSNHIRKNYLGLIITDEINMLKRNPIYYFIYLNKALKANSDIILIKIKNARDGYKVINKYKKILIRDNECVKKLNDSVERIITIKNKYKIDDSTNNIGIDIEKINEEIDKINMVIDD